MTAGDTRKRSRAVHHTIPFILLMSIFMVYYRVAFM
jgi:hypothetical protein